MLDGIIEPGDTVYVRPLHTLGAVHQIVKVNLPPPHDQIEAQLYILSTLNDDELHYHFAYDLGDEREGR